MSGFSRPPFVMLMNGLFGLAIELLGRYRKDLELTKQLSFLNQHSGACPMPQQRVILILPVTNLTITKARKSAIDFHSTRVLMPVCRIMGFRADQRR